MSGDLFPAKAYKLRGKLQWAGVQNIPQMSYTCGHCGSLVSNNHGYLATVLYETPAGSGRNNLSSAGAYIHLCHICEGPTYFAFDGNQYPVGTAGRSFRHVPPDLVDVYAQAQKCFKAECYAASVMMARRLLMVLAWRLQAADGLSFQKYVDYFVECGAISPAMKGWVDKIRQIGNATNHEIPDTTQEDAQNALRFVELIFDNVFEAPSAAGVSSPFNLRP